MTALLPKPRMRNLLARSIKIRGTIGALITFGVVATYWTVVIEPRPKIYAEFYKNYDPMKEFEAMKKTGVFQSARPEDK